MIFLTKYFTLLRIPNFYFWALLCSLGLTYDSYVHDVWFGKFVVLFIAMIFFMNCQIGLLASAYFFNDIMASNRKRVIQLPSTCTHLFYVASFLSMAAICLAHCAYVSAVFFMGTIFFDIFLQIYYTKHFENLKYAITQSFFPEL